MVLHHLHRDIETRSVLDLTEVGAARYAADPTTGIWCVGYTLGDGPARLWHPGEPIPGPFIAAARNPVDWNVVAHNDAFERAIEEHILAPRYGFPLLPIERHRCSMAQALACALPGKLEKVAAVLGLPFQKDAEGARLMKLMAKPRKPRAGEDPNAGPYWHDEPEKIARLGAYCIRDVEVERALYHRLPELGDAEQAHWVLDAAINARGFYTDGALLDAAARMDAGFNQATQIEIAEITAGAVTSTNQVAKLRAWLAERGCAVPDMAKGTLKAALRRKAKALDPAARRAIELRLGAAFDTKCETMIAYRGAGGRIRGCLQFHGAATGRWAARGVQVQNFTRDPGDVDAKIAAIMAGDMRAYPQPLGAIADAARGAIRAAPGSRFLIGDFSGIESRVLAWIAGETTKLDQWRKFDATGDPTDEPYFILGRACGMPPEKARQGKFVDLAFGYQGGINAYAGTTYEDDPSTDTERETFKRIWRERHPRTVAFWYDTDRAAIRAVRNHGAVHAAKGASFCADADFLKLMLPSGRVVRYPFPRIEKNNFGDSAVFFKDTALTAPGRWGDCNYGHGAYGGLWTENIVQGIARDLLAEAMQRLEAAGYKIVLTVHDEIIAEVPAGFGSLEEFKRLLIATPAWAEGLPIAAKVREGPRFNKPAEPAANHHGDDDRGESQFDDGENMIPLAAEGLASEAPAEPAGEPPPFTFTFEQIRAAFERPCDETPGKGNGHDKGGNGYSGDSAGPTGNGHGERDTGQQVAFYVYRHADGSPYLGVKRTSTKQFPQFHWTGTAWVKGAPDGPRIPYRLPELIKTPLDAWVLICAGEKDTESAAALGFTATCNPEGERKGAWVAELNAWFAGRKHVAIMEDNDSTGRAHVIEVANALRGIVPDIRIVRFRELAEHGDLSDWIALGYSYADLLARITAAAPFYRKPTPAPLREWAGKPVPRPAYVVPDRIPAGQVFLFSGEGAEGKSTVIQHLCSAHVLGAGWLGSTPRLGPAIYLECEDAEQVLWWRQAAIAEHYGIGLDAFADAGLQLYSLIEHDAILAVTNRTGIVEPTPAFDWLYELAGDTKPVMIAIASVANVFAGNESNRSEVQQFAKLLTRLAHVAGGSVALIAHPSLTGASSSLMSHEGLSGSTGWHNAFRARAVMRTIKPQGATATLETGVREIVFRKNQYGPASATCFVRWQNGLYLPVEGVCSMDAAERANKADQVFIELLKRWTEQGRKVSANPNPNNYAPTTFARQPEAAGLTKDDFARAMERLLKEGLIENRTVTRRGNEKRSYLAIPSRVV